LLGMLLSAIAIFLSNQLSIREQLHLRQLVQQQTVALQTELTQELSAHIRTLRRIAVRWVVRWQTSGVMERSAWETAAQTEIQDFSGYQSIAWIDAKLRIRWVVPLAGNEALQDLDLSQNNVYATPLHLAHDLQQPMLSPLVALPQGEQGILVGVPLFVGDRFDGWIGGILQIPQIFENNLPIPQGYRIRLSDQTGGVLYAQAPLPPSSALWQTAQITAYGANWQLEVFPEPSLITKMRSPLPTVVLATGVASAWILALTLDLALRSREQAHRNRRMNQQLQGEIALRQEQDAKLRASQERWELALQGNNDGIWDWNIQTNQVFFSARWKEILGFQDDEIANHIDQWSKRIHPDDLAQVMQRLQDHFDRKTPCYISEYQLQGKDGSYKWILDRGQAIWDEAGKPVRMAGSHTDITDRKQTELALRESEARYRHLIDNLHAGFVVHIPDTQILLANETACRLLGVSMEQILGQTATAPIWHFTREDGSVLPVDDYPVNRVRQTGQPLKNYVIGIRNSDASQGWGLVNAFPEWDAAGQLRQIVVTFIDITDLKQTENQLREMQAVLENAVSGISRLDVQGHYLYVNKAYASATGYEPEEMMGLPWQSTVHPEDLEKLEMAYQQMLQEGKVEVEAKGIRRDGTIFYKELVMIAAYDDQRHVAGHHCFLKDISDRKRAEEALQISQKRFAGILEVASDAIISIDARQRITLFNRGAEKVFGYAAAEILGQPLSWLLPDRYTAIYANHVQQFSQCGETVVTGKQREIWGRRKDGTEFAAEVSISRLVLGDDVLFTAFLQDITERKAAELALRQSEEKFRTAIDFTHDWEYWLAPDGSFVYISPACERMTGYTPQDFIQQPYLLSEIVYSADRPLMQQHHCDISDSPVAANVDFRIVTRSGAVRWVSHVCQPVFNPAGQHLGRRISNRDIHDRKLAEAEREQAQQALQESEARFQAFMNHSPALAWIIDASGVMVYVNQTYHQVLQLAAVDPIGKSLWDLYPPDIAQHFLDALQTVAQTGQVLERIEPIPRRNGESGDFLVYTFPMPDGAGRSLVGGVAIDITRQRQAEEGLRQSEATKQAMIEAIPDLLMRMRSDGSNLEFISNSEFNVVPPDCLRQGCSLADVLPPDLAQMRLRYVQRALQSGRVQIYEQDIAVAGGQRHEEIRILPLPADEVLVMVRDVTDRKRAELELRHQKEMFQAIVTHSPVMIALFNADGQVQFINPALEQILGWSLAEWQQKNRLADCYPDAIARQQVVDHLLAATGKWQDFATLTASGETIETTWAIVYLSSGSFLAIGQDIRDRKHQERALRQAMEAAEASNLAKSTFLANMSHELRTPLNVILGFAQVMMYDPELTPGQKEDLETIQRSGDHLLNLINDVLDLSKIEAGHYTLEETGFDLITLLHTLHTMFAERAKSKALQFQVEIAPEVPQFVVTDPQKLRQILLNLLSNAVKFTKSGGIMLRVGTEPQMLQGTASPLIRLHFAVTDTGVGIAPEEIDTVFEAFVQAQAGRQSGGGTGLGLAISRKLLELMGGTMSVNSLPGQGSTFTFTLPVSPTNREDISLESCDRRVMQLVPGQPHHRVLVVDDQPENRLLMVRLMTQLGLEAREAHNGQDAVQLWREWKPDLIWMDIRMPVLDGYEATRQIRAMEPDRGSVIIALTAQSSQSDRTLALAAGCNDYISKPFREETLFLKMQEHLGLQYLYSDGGSPTPKTADPVVSLAEQACDEIKRIELTDLPPDWLAKIEDATICGDDQTIAALISQLPSSAAKLATCLGEWNRHYQFERILQLLENLPS